MTSDIASAVINCAADDVFDFMADASKLDLWSFGTWRIELIDPGLVQGKAMHDGSAIYVRVLPHHKQRLIDYQVGHNLQSMTSRIFARVVSGVEFGAGDQSSMLLMVALRGADMDDARWCGLTETHAVEVRLIKSLIETGYDHRREPYE